MNFDIAVAAGIYQLWSLNNRGIGIDYLETIADPKGNSVLLDVLEHCNVWWFPPFSHQDVRGHFINRNQAALLSQTLSQCMHLSPEY